MILTHLLQFRFWAGATASDAPPPVPVAEVTPAGGRRRRRERFIARYKGRDYEFESPEQIEAFMQSVRTPAQKRRGKHPAVRIMVPHAVEQDLARFDLPSIRAELARFDWRSAMQTWHRYAALKQSQRIDFEQSRRHQDYLFARQLEMEDEELLLL